MEINRQSLHCNFSRELAKVKKKAESQPKRKKKKKKKDYHNNPTNLSGG